MSSELQLFDTEKTGAEVYASVAPEVPVGGRFTYLVPPQLIERVRVGVRVEVPFGGRKVRAFVLELPGTCDVEPRRLRELAAVLDPEPVLAPEVLQLAEFAAEYYASSLGEVLAAAIPGAVGGASSRRSAYSWVRRTAGEPSGRIGKAQQKALDALVEGPQTLGGLREQGVSTNVLTRLAERGLIMLDAEPPEVSPEEGHVLTDEQTLVLAPLLKQVEAGGHKVTLLHGVTGSGKTEVYLRAIGRALELGRTAIVLVPEISLTPQTQARFQARFGFKVALLHSQQNAGQRRREWRRIQSGDARVVIGPRSAVWAPCRDLGLIVVDEEHENTYKQENSPRYNARDLAVVRGKQADVPVILGSATPSLESWNNAVSGRYRLARLRKRPGGSTLPEVRIVDMGREWADVKGAPLLSRVLLNAMQAALARGEQVLLFQNRRGFTTYLMCTACGHVLRCGQCDITLTYHRGAGATICHFCDHRSPPPGGSCPACMGPPLKQWGAGTERVADIVQGLFPKASVGRLDTDVVRGGEKSETVLARFRSGEVSILIGTQMIAKGLDIHNVTVVGVISADTSLNLPDFRAAERTFQLIAQVAGRAGRGDRPGVTVVQTFLPEQFAIRAAADHHFEQFAKQELSARRALSYPPYSRVLKILVRGPVPDRVEAEADAVARTLRSAGFDKKEVHGILGPAASPRAYLAGKHRFQILVKGSHMGVRRVLAVLALRKVPTKVERIVDVDPFHLL